MIKFIDYQCYSMKLANIYSKTNKILPPDQNLCSIYIKNYPLCTEKSHANEMSVHLSQRYTWIMTFEL